MIVGIPHDAARLEKLSPLFQKAFEFLRSTDPASLPDGRHAIDGERLFVIAATDDGRGHDRARLETHRKYIDIQYVVSGTEEIGWRSATECRGGLGYDDAREIEFYTDTPALWFPVPPGSFAIFFPEDAHAPLAGKGKVRKLVVKVAVAEDRP